MIQQARVLVLSCLLFSGSALSSPLFSQQAQAQEPEENRFTPVVVVDHGVLDEPMAFEVLRDGTVYIAERKGALRMFDPTTSTTVLVDSLEVNRTYTPADGEVTTNRVEDGLVGFTVDPNFEENRWAYFIYSHPTEAKQVLSRMELRGSTLLRDTEVTVLEYQVQRETCCHTGGGMTWDTDGNLYIATGNNTGNVETIQTDQRAGRMNWDDQRGSANTNDLRGKILRIRPQPDGSYTIPEGNLFAPGTPRTRPEIYAMGARNAWRVSVDSETGYVYWGDIGPDSTEPTDSTVEGYDEVNQAREPGYFGWPYFIGPNRAYPVIDYETEEILPPKDPTQPINDSRWNTGLRELPPAQPAFISYPYGLSEQFPELGTGGRCSVGGPIHRRADVSDAARPWPATYDGTMFIADCVRNWVMVIDLDENSDPVSVERFLSNYVPIEPLDLKFGPDGDLYVLEYGSIWFTKSPDSRLVRIEYNAGNRAPLVVATADTKGGAVPFSVNLSSEGTSDPDGDALSYEWRVGADDDGSDQTFRGPDATVSFDQPGVYSAVLTVTDAAEASSSEPLRIVAGNEPPEIAVQVAGNQTFFFPDEPIHYSVEVSDREDERMVAERLALSIDYVPDGFDLSALAQGEEPVGAATRFAVPEAIMSGTDCRSCHQPEARSVGPSFREIATRYSGDETAVARLVETIREGGSGEWGDVVMPAHVGLSAAEATALVRYILASNGEDAGLLPLDGSYVPEIPEEDSGTGSVIIRAVYTDGGAADLPAQTSGEIVALRSPVAAAGAAEVLSDVRTQYDRGSMITEVIPARDGYIGYTGLDLTGIRRLELAARATSRAGEYVGARIELRLDSPTGEVIGNVDVTTDAAEQDSGGDDDPALTVDLPPLDGVHDLYLVFRNDEARPIDPLLNLSTIRFVKE